MPVLGVPHRIQRENAPSLPPVRIIDGEIRVRGDPAHLERRVRTISSLQRETSSRRARGGWQRRSAARSAGQCARYEEPLGQLLGARNNSFSWRLIFAPEAVLDYVVAHEVAHLVEMNHGPRFWDLVERLAPRSAGPRSWLKRHRDRLLSYG